MQREVLHGIPYFLDKQGVLYAWTGPRTDSEPVRVGKYDSVREQAVLDDGILDKLKPALDKWRLEEKPRNRKSS